MFRIFCLAAIAAALCAAAPSPVVNKEGATIGTRFPAPEGFKRVAAPQGSFAAYLRGLPLKPDGAKALYYNGAEKPDRAYCAVVDMEISPKDLQQCADAVIRLRGEYFYSLGQYDKISFKLTNGFAVDYTKWMEGYRVSVSGNKTSWYKAAQPSNTYKDFRAYMDFVFMYAGTLSLSASLHKKDIRDIAPGDVFVVGGSPGHAVIVVDVAVDGAGKKVFMLAQSYMPAQQTQILRNPGDAGLSPWYRADFPGELRTPEWTFSATDLKTW